MQIIKGENYSNKIISATSIHYIDCNFVQHNQGIEQDVHGCIFENCNLVNCIIPEDNGIINCNTATMDFKGEF